MLKKLTRKSNSGIEEEKSINEKIQTLYRQGTLKYEQDNLKRTVEFKREQKTSGFIYRYLYEHPKKDIKKLKKALREEGYKCIGIFGKFLFVYSYNIKEKREKLTDEEFEQLYEWIKELLEEAAYDGEQKIYIGKKFIQNTQSETLVKGLVFLVFAWIFSEVLILLKLEIIGVFLLRAYLDGNDMHARQKMHAASCLAGLAFNSASLGLTHGMAHQLGANFHIPHGRANAMLLPHIIEYNADIHKDSRSQSEYHPSVKRYSTIAHILGLSSYNKVMSVRSLIQWIQFMNQDMKIPARISEIGTITVNDYMSKVETMAEAALADACTATNPRTPDKEAIMQIYRNLW